MHIVLLEPEIPANTGNIGRTCAATGTSLHLIHPLGFLTDDKTLKRAGMDYWFQLDVHEYTDFGAFLEQHAHVTIYMATTKAEKNYAEVRFRPNDFIMFGKESAGIPEEILLKYKETAIRIPMRDNVRSLNLSNAASIVLYEALRQQQFAGLQTEGQLHRFHW